MCEFKYSLLPTVITIFILLLPKKGLHLIIVYAMWWYVNVHYPWTLANNKLILIFAWIQQKLPFLLMHLLFKILYYTAVHHLCIMIWWIHLLTHTHLSYHPQIIYIIFANRSCVTFLLATITTTLISKFQLNLCEIISQVKTSSS